MLVTIFAAALASDPSALDLNLICHGQYEDTETTRGQAQAGDGDGQSTTVTLRRSVMRPGTAKVSFHGSSGELTYPDGRTRALANVVADERRITADYERRLLVLRTTWRVDVSRLSGDITVSSGSDVAFQGVCSAEPTQPRF